MSSLNQEAVCLRFFGDHLDPRQLSRQLGAEATYAWRKGELWSNQGVGDLRETGGWVLNGHWDRLFDINAQLAELFGKLDQDLSLWDQLVRSFYADVYCGFFLGQPNGQTLLSPCSMKMLGARGLKLSMDIWERDGRRARMP